MAAKGRQSVTGWTLGVMMLITVHYVQSCPPSLISHIQKFRFIKLISISHREIRIAVSTCQLNSFRHRKKKIPNYLCLCEKVFATRPLLAGDVGRRVPCPKNPFFTSWLTVQQCCQMGCGLCQSPPRRHESNEHHVAFTCARRTQEQARLHQERSETRPPHLSREVKGDRGPSSPFRKKSSRSDRFDGLKDAREAANFQNCHLWSPPFFLFLLRQQSWIFRKTVKILKVKQR